MILSKSLELLLPKTACSDFPSNSLLGIARNLLRERARILKRRKEVTWTELCLEADESADELQGLYDDVKEHLPACVETLGGNARRAVQMHYGAKLKFREIGQRLQRSTAAIKVLVFRARQSLKRCLDRKLRGAADE